MSTELSRFDSRKLVTFTVKVLIVEHKIYTLYHVFINF